jgi:hypothetical protein
MRELAKGETKELSEKARFRLKVFDWYRNSSPRFSLSAKPEARLICRHFGIHRSYFYRWKKRYESKRLSAPENKPTIPKRKREPVIAGTGPDSAGNTGSGSRLFGKKDTTHPLAGVGGRSQRVHARQAHSAGEVVVQGGHERAQKAKPRRKK